MKDNPWQKPMREWSIHTDVDAVIDWNKRMQRKAWLAKVLAYLTAQLIYGGVIAFVAWMLISYPIDH